MSLDDAYANSAYIPDGEGYYARWAGAAMAFREGHGAQELGVSYGAGQRQTFDIYYPDATSKGTVIIVHGGYWMACTPFDFSHLAAGSVAAGYACAMVCHTLCPDARLAEITQEVALAIGAIAAHNTGPIHLTGHSSGGHLVARMVCRDIVADWQARVVRVMPISPVSDLEPLLRTKMKQSLCLDDAECITESPVRHDRHEIPVTVWVGGDERPAFLDQSRLLANRWGCENVIEPSRHHFDVIEGLEAHDSAMMRALLK